MKRAWQWFVDLMSRRERGTVLATMRIGLGLVVVYSLLSIALAGLVEALWVDASYGGMLTLKPSWWVNLLGGANPTTIWMLWSLALVGAVGTVAGFGGRVPLILLVIAYQPIARINPVAHGGYEALIGNAAWILLLGQASATLSVDCKRRHGTWTSNARVGAWPRYVLLFQLLVVYTATGLHKLSADWVPGGGSLALYWVLHDPTWPNFDLREAAAGWMLPLLRLGTLVAWFFEVTAVGMLAVFYWRDTADRGGRIRRWANRWDLRIGFALVGITLHVGILVLLNVGPFSWISLCYYVLLWTPDELEGFARRIAHLARR